MSLTPNADEDDDTRAAAARAPSSSGPWSRAAEDLSGERLLRNCPRVTVEGSARPVLDRYALLSKLGQGGMGVVYHAVHAKLGTEVAIKLLPLALHAHQQGLVERFEREARLAAQLRSDHLVSVLDIAEDDPTGCHFIVMEYVHGAAADRWLRRHPLAPRVPEQQALDVCIAATRGLVSAHLAGVVHRDIKPANILIPYDADARPLLDRAKLADLGLARTESGEQSLAGPTGSSIAMGTPGYMSPEQGADAKRAKKPADVFSMGATLYALLCGSAPFAGSSASDALVRTAQGRYRPLAEARPDVSPVTALLVTTCLDPEPSRRFADAHALLEALLTARTALADADGDTTRAVSALHGLANEPERGLPVVTPIPDGTETQADRASDAPDPAAAPLPTSPGHEDPSQTVVRGRAPSKTAVGADGVAGRAAPGPVSPTPSPSPSPTAGAPAAHVAATTATQTSPARAGLWVALAALAAIVAAVVLLDPGDDSTAARTDVTPVPGPTRPAPPMPTPAEDAPVRAVTAPTPPAADVAPVLPTTSPAPSADVLVTIDSRPSGAEVLVDDRVVGRTPLRAVAVQPGSRTVRLRLDEHVETSRSVSLAAGTAADLGVWPLEPWPVLDLTRIGDGVTATVGGVSRSGRVATPPGRVRIELARDGHERQTIERDAAPGDTVVVESGAWTPFVPDIDPILRKRLLTDVRAWDAATSAQRRLVAEWVDARLPDVALTGALQPFSCGRQSHEIAVFRHATTGLELALVPVGNFRMGSPATEPARDADEDQLTVALTAPFLVARTETTQAAWERVMQTAPSKSKGAALPVERVTWDEAKAFCDRAGLALPTEAQWEWACRAGVSSRWCFGDEEQQIGEHAWTFANSGGRTHEVATRRPNAFGVFDVHGNVWEWCADGYGPYPRFNATDPAGAAAPVRRVTRGGGWYDAAPLARCANRCDDAPDTRQESVGFRVVRPVPVD